MIPGADVMRARLARATVAPDLSIEKSLRVLDAGGMGILLLIQADGRLAGLVTDGDIRRAMLRHQSFALPIESVATRTPVTASASVTESEALRLLNHARSFLLNHLTLVDEQGRPTGLVLRSDL